MTKKYLTPDQFREAARREEDVSDAVVRVAVDTEIRADEDDDRKVRFVISTGSIDRMGDTISVNGWDLKAFRRNPVVLWAHDASMLPVAKASDIRIEDDALKATAEFTPAGMVRFNDIVVEMLRRGFLSATSVGFAPKAWRFAEDDDRRFGIDFEEQELLEFSVVPVPANSEALVEARGLDTGPMHEWALRALGAGMTAVSEAELKRLQAAEQELIRLKAEQLREPSVAQFPRLTEAALRQAGIR